MLEYEGELESRVSRREIFLLGLTGLLMLQWSTSGIRLKTECCRTNTESLLYGDQLQGRELCCVLLLLYSKFLSAICSPRYQHVIHKFHIRIITNLNLKSVPATLIAKSYEVPRPTHLACPSHHGSSPQQRQRHLSLGDPIFPLCTHLVQIVPRTSRGQYLQACEEGGYAVADWCCAEG